MRSVSLLCLLALLGGCAFTEMKLPLSVKGLDPTVAGGDGREIVVVVPFADDRNVKRCGMKKNGYNMDTADVRCQGDPARWLGKLLADELRASGFRVLGPDDAHKPSAVRLDGALLKVFVEPVIGAWSGSLEADLQVKLVATSDTGLRAERVFFVKGAKKGLMVVTDQPVQTAFNRATQDVLREMVQAFVVKPEEVSRLDDRQWTVTSAPAAPASSDAVSDPAAEVPKPPAPPVAP